jgi:ABC-type transporter Mla MlaB component
MHYTTSHNGNSLTVAINDELNYSNAEEFIDLNNKQIESLDPKIQVYEIDLSNVADGIIDEAAIASLYIIADQLKDKNIKLQLLCSEKILSKLAIVKFECDKISSPNRPRNNQ